MSQNYENYRIIAYLLSPIARKAKLSHFAIIIARLATLQPMTKGRRQPITAKLPRSVPHPANSNPENSLKRIRLYVMRTYGLNLCSTLNRKFVSRTFVKRSITVYYFQHHCAGFYVQGVPAIRPFAIRQQLMSPKVCRFDSQTRQFDIQISCATHPVESVATSRDRILQIVLTPLTAINSRHRSHTLMTTEQQTVTVPTLFNRAYDHHRVS